jgi:hypothetical protein
MSPEDFYRTIQRPALAEFAHQTGILSPLSAQRLLLAIAIQESDLVHRYQRSRGVQAGPARGWWQFERLGGVEGVLTHPRSKTAADKWCLYCNVEPFVDPVWRALEGHDWLAAGFARLLLWTDPQPIPTEQHEAWTCYARRLWRPGKPHPAVWPQHWQAAGEAIPPQPAP